MIIAQVNNYEIKKHEYELELHNTLVRMKLEDANDEARNSAVNQLIEGYLLLHSARNSGVSISDSDIDKRFVEISMKFQSRDEFDKALEARNLNEELLREQITNELTIKSYIGKEFSNDKAIDEEKLKKIYQENLDSFKTQEMVKASHILVKNEEADCQAKIETIRARINSATDFEKEAKECSECPSCCNHGDLGFFTRGKMVKEFEDAAFSLQVGEISQPIKTPFGYHILMVTDSKPSKIAEFEEVKDSLKKRVQQIEMELGIVRHIKELKANAEIKIFEDRL